MKKRLLFLMFSACILCAVSLRFLAKEEKQQTVESAVENENSEDTLPVEKPLVAAETSTPEADVVREDLRLKEPETVFSDVEEVSFLDEFSYCYHCLTEEEQKVYREIYGILSSFGEGQTLSMTDPDQIGDIFQCVLNDHPEIFYVQGYTYTSYTRGDEIVRLTLSGTYTMTPEEVSFCEQGIEEYAEECLSGLSEEASDYEKVKYVYEYIIGHTEYQQNSPENQNICSVFLNGRSVCQGYAKATQYLLNRAGVFCTLVIGSVSAGEGHAWNLVQMDGNYYYVDTTWGDASYQMEEGAEDAWEQKLPDINYDYLGVTTEQLLKTHTLNHVVPLPACISMDCNYYVKEGTYVTSCEEEVLRQIFEENYDRNEKYITIKCADETVYQQVRQLLLEEQKIFTYLHQADGTVAYSDNEQQCSLSFWLW